MAEKTKKEKTAAPEKAAKVTKPTKAAPVAKAAPAAKAAKKGVRERKPSALRKDHLKVIAALARDLPKRTALSMADIAKSKFKDGDNITADRIARNSVRKPRQMGLVEICERGEYRLTPAGAAFHKNVDSYTPAPDMEREAKSSKKGTAKKAAKPEKVTKAVKTAKDRSPAKAEKPVKKAVKAAKPAAKKVAEKPAKKAKVRTSDPDFPDDPEDRVNSKSEATAPLPQDEEAAAAEA